MNVTEKKWDVRLSQQWREIAACVDRYEEAAASELPELSGVLQGVSAAYRSEALVELVLLDMEYRQKRGRPKSPEAYLEEFPELRDHAERLSRGGQRQGRENRISESPPGPTLPLKTVPTKPLAAGGDGGAVRERKEQIAPAGEAIGPYLVREELGRGGFGVVYRCYDPALEREVAIKVAREPASENSDSLKAFRHEAAAAAALRHANLVTVLAYGESGDGRPYIVYEYVAGSTLARRIERRDYSLAQGVEWVAAVADALHEAHRRQIVHRDVKPNNILIDERGVAHLTDFGLAKREERFFGTDRGTVLGTPWYLSPEQAGRRSDWASPAADIYSLGVVLYEVLCGRVPFRSAHLDDLLEQVLHRRPDAPRTVNDRIPPALEEVCLKALAKDPADRYRTGHDMARALRAAVAVRRRLWIPLAGLAAALLLFAGGLWGLFGGSASLPPLEITKLGVYVVPAGESRDYRLPDHGPPHEGDRLEFHGELNRDAYVYWILFQDHDRPRWLWPLESDRDNPQPKHSLDSSDTGQAAICVGGGEGVCLLLCGASDKPLSRADRESLEALQVEFPPPQWDGKLHTAVKPGRQERPDEDIRGGGVRVQPFRVPQPLRNLAEQKFNAYYASMFSHFARQASAGDAKPQHY